MGSVGGSVREPVGVPAEVAAGVTAELSAELSTERWAGEAVGAEAPETDGINMRIWSPVFVWLGNQNPITRSHPAIDVEQVGVAKVK